jgi:hypothetical protein
MKKVSSYLILLVGTASAIGIGSCGYQKAITGSYDRSYSWSASGFTAADDTDSTNNTDIVQTVAANLSALNITFATGDTAENVTQNFTVPTSLQDCSITWTASDGGVVSIGENGIATITRPQSATNSTITLTAAVTKGSATATKSFDVVVVRSLSDSEAVASCKSRLTTSDITFAAPDTAAAITQNISQPTTYSDCSLAWSSGTSAIISNAGVVTRPSGVGATDATVTLTATISKGFDSDTKALTVVVLHNTTDAEAVAAAMASFSISAITFNGGDTASTVTQDITLPSTYGGCAITWSSGTSATISNAGVVTRPASGAANATVTLTATFSRNADAGATSTKSVDVTVLKHTDATYVASCKSLLSTNDFTFSGTDTASSVTGNITLPASKGSCTLTWSSDTAAVIANNGIYGTRPLCNASNATVTLTATIGYNGASDTKALTVSAPKWTPALAIAHDLPLVAIGYTGGDAVPTSVNNNITLPTSGPYGTSVSWTSDIPTHIPNGSSGIVTQGYGTQNSTVTLTAAVACSTTSQTTTFPLTVVKKGTLDIALNDTSLEAGTTSGTEKMSVTVVTPTTLNPAGPTVMYRVCTAVSPNALLSSIAGMDSITSTGTCITSNTPPQIIGDLNPVCCTTSSTSALRFQVPTGNENWFFRVYSYANGDPNENHHKRLYDESGTVNPNN